jgi:hypothetical protein
MIKRAFSQAVARLATTGLLIGSVIAPATADNVLFYNVNTGVAAVGHVASDGAYWDVKSLAYDRGWTNIVCASNGTLLFYNRSTGQAASARIAGDGTHTDLQNISLTPGWSHIVPLSQGKLLFYQRNTGLMSTGVLNTDGSFYDLRDIPGVEPGWDFLVETWTGQLLMHNNQVYNGKAALGQVAPDGNLVSHRAYPTFGGWPQMIPLFDNGALVYESVFGTGAFIALGTGTPITPRKVNGMKAGWDFVVATSSNTLLGYNYSSGEMMTGTWTAGAEGSLQFVPRQSGRFDPYWSHIVVLR